MQPRRSRVLPHPTPGVVPSPLPSRCGSVAGDRRGPYVGDKLPFADSRIASALVLTHV